MEDQVELTYTWQPFILNRHIPSTGVGYKQYLEAVYGRGMDFSSSRRRLTEAGAECSPPIAFNFKDDALLFPTVRSHAAVEFMRARGKANEMMEHLFCNYFERNRSLYDPTTLVDSAVAAGLDAKDAPALRDYVLDSAHLEDVLEREAAFKREYPSCTGVPYFVFRASPRDIELSGAQPVELFKKVLVQMQPPVNLALETSDSLSERPVKELKALAKEAGVDLSGLLEKREIVAALLRHASPVCDPSDPNSCL